MKIAYILHGHARTWKQCYENFFTNVHSVLPGDIYLHAWDRTNAYAGSNWNGWGKSLNGHLGHLSAQPVDIAELVSVYKPKHFIFETDPGTQYLSSRYGQVHPSDLGLINYLYGQRKIFDTIAQLGNTYDKYFFVRYDINFKTKLDIDEFYVNGLLVPSWVTHGELFDIWKLGNPQECRVLMDFIDVIYARWYMARIYHGTVYEAALGKYCTDHGIPLINSKVEWEFVRLG